MNRRLLAVLVFALVVSGTASVLVYHLILANVQAAGRNAKTHKVLVASHELEAGTLIQSADLRWVESAAALPMQALMVESEALGRGVISTIYEGEPLSPSRLATKGAGAGLASMIPIGKRAVALRVNEVVGLAGFVVPGMRVDVIISGAGMTDTGRNILSRTVLQNIEVLSAGHRIEKSGDGKPQSAEVVNLLVTPDQAEILSLASGETKVQLVLRNPLDTREQTTSGTSIAALFGQTIAAPVAAPRPVVVRQPEVAAKREPEPTVEVFNGIKRSEQTIPR
jgi:pilus assembly protein CpaB